MEIAVLNTGRLTEVVWRLTCNEKMPRVKGYLPRIEGVQVSIVSLSPTAGEPCRAGEEQRGLCRAHPTADHCTVDHTHKYHYGDCSGDSLNNLNGYQKVVWTTAVLPLHTLFAVGNLPMSVRSTIFY